MAISIIYVDINDFVQNPKSLRVRVDFSSISSTQGSESKDYFIYLYKIRSDVDTENINDLLFEM